jgi:hypothetical protein
MLSWFRLELIPCICICCTCCCCWTSCSCSIWMWRSLLALNPRKHDFDLQHTVVASYCCIACNCPIGTRMSCCDCGANETLLDNICSKTNQHCHHMCHCSPAREACRYHRPEGSEVEVAVPAEKMWMINGTHLGTYHGARQSTSVLSRQADLPGA